MNTGRLKELIDQITSAERRAQTQPALQELGGALTNVVNQPQSPQHQDSLAEKLDAFQTSLEKFKSAFSPRELEIVEGLHDKAFAPLLGEVISTMITQNPMSPNVVNDYVQNLFSERQTVFSNLKNMSGHFDFFGIGYDEVPEGTAELGFQIPRKFFDNDFDGLIDELAEIRTIIRFVSEASLGSYEPVKVGTISTTDPLIFVAMAELLAAKIGSLVTWGLGVWLGVETIRHLRAQTAKAQSFSEEEIESFFGNKIKADIEAKVEEKVQQILDEGNAEEARKGELQGHLKWALESLLSKVERGMTVELRLAPPPLVDTGAEGEDGGESDERTAIHESLRAIQSQLKFPTASEDPILRIPTKGDETEE